MSIIFSFDNVYNDIWPAGPSGERYFSKITQYNEDMISTIGDEPIYNAEYFSTIGQNPDYNRESDK